MFEAAGAAMLIEFETIGDATEAYRYFADVLAIDKNCMEEADANLGSRRLSLALPSDADVTAVADIAHYFNGNIIELSPLG